MAFDEKLIQLYQEMYEHTRGECAHNCRIPHSCCDAFACEMTAWFAAEHGVTLQPTGHPKLPFMGEHGCVVPPHLRPNCTVHTCAIGSLGFKPGDRPWTERYFQIRVAIMEHEQALNENSQ